MTLFLLFVCPILAQTAKFPDTLASWQDVLVSKDLSRSKLSGAIDESTLSIPVADGTKFTQFQVVVVEGEQIQICSITANTLTACGRGFNGTTAAAHIAGVAVMGSPTAAHHNRLAAEVLGLQNALGANLSNVVKNNADVLFKRMLVWDSAEAGSTSLTIQAGTGQAGAPLQEWKASSGGVIAALTADGKLGIGTSAPAFALDVNGVVNATSLYVNGAPYIGSQWTTSGNDIYYIAGRVGVGKASPSSALDVSGTVTATQFSGSGAGLTSIPWGSITGLEAATPTFASVRTSATYANGDSYLTASDNGTTRFSIKKYATIFTEFSSPAGFYFSAPSAVFKAGNGAANFQLEGGATSEHVFRTWNGSLKFATTGSNGTGDIVFSPKDVQALKLANGGAATFASTVTATQFNGSGAGLTSDTVPIASLVAGDYSSRITSGTYSISISGNAATATTASSANAVAWGDVSGKPSALANITPTNGWVRAADLGCGESWNTTSCDAGQNGLIDYADNAGTVGGLPIHTSRNNEPNRVVRTDGNGDIQAGLINTDSSDAGTTGIARIYASNDNYIRYYTLANFSAQLTPSWENVQSKPGWITTKEVSFVYGGDPNTVIPATTIPWVWRAQHWNATFVNAFCQTDVGTVVVEIIRTNDGGVMASKTCGTAPAWIDGGSNWTNGYQWVPAGYGLSIRTSSVSNVKNLSVQLYYSPS